MQIVESKSLFPEINGLDMFKHPSDLYDVSCFSAESGVCDIWPTHGGVNYQSLELQ